MDEEIHREADGAVSIVGLAMKIFLYLLAFAAFGVSGYLACRWMFFS